jgi:hypothetical protein
MGRYACKLKNSSTGETREQQIDALGVDHALKRFCQRKWFHEMIKDSWRGDGQKPMQLQITVESVDMATDF